MRAKDIKQKLCMDLNIKKHFVAVIPSYVLTRIECIQRLYCNRNNKYAKFQVFVVLTNILPGNFDCEGHFITLIKHIDHFEL